MKNVVGNRAFLLLNYIITAGGEKALVLAIFSGISMLTCTACAIN